MTPKDKAEELIIKYSNFVSAWTHTSKPKERPTARFEGIGMKIGRAKQCALIAIEEIENVGCWVSKEFAEKEGFGPESTEEFWRDVRMELERF